MSRASLFSLLLILTFLWNVNTLNHCTPECTERRNVIVIVGRGGLNERLFVYSKMSGVANYLCAHLIFPSPCESLAARYNRYRSVSCNMTWSDFIMIRPSEACGDDMIIKAEMNITGLAIVNNISTAVNFKKEHRIPFIWTLGDEIIITPTANLLFNITKYIQRDMLSTRHDPILSQSRRHVVDFNDLESIFDMSPLIVQHTEKIMKNNNLFENNFIVFQVRRGDLKRLCTNSELDGIPLHLHNVFKNCPSFNSTTKTVSAQMAHMPVVFFSDEGNYIYRSEVMRAFHEIGFRDIIDGDFIIREYIQDTLTEQYDNNYVIFRVATVIQKNTNKLVQIHGHHGCGVNKRLCES